MKDKGLPMQPLSSAAGRRGVGVAITARLGVGGEPPPPPPRLLVPPEAHWTWLLCTKTVQLVVQSAGRELVSVTQGVLVFRVGRY